MTDGGGPVPGEAGDGLISLGTTEVGAVAVVTVAGELDLHTVRALTAEIEVALARPGLAAIVIDLSGVTFLGSSGLGTLAEIATRPAEPPVPVGLVAPPEHRTVVRPWEVLNLRPILPMFPDVGAALSGLGPV